MSAGVSHIGLDRDRDRIVGEHESLQCLMAKAIVSHGGQHQRRGARGKILFFSDAQFGAIEEMGTNLRGAGAVAKEIVRTDVWHLLQKIRQRREPPMLWTFAKQRELGPMI